MSRNHLRLSGTFGLLAVTAALGAGAADYSWLVEPATANWLGDANWSSGIWSAGTGDTATFGASSETTVNVNGDVALGGLTVAGANGAPIGKQVWKLTLADGGRALCASYSRATVLILR